MTLHRVGSVNPEPIVYNDNEPTRVQTRDDNTSLFTFNQTERRTSSANHLFTLHTTAYVDHREAIPILHVKYRAQFLRGVGWGGMSYWVYVTLSCHNWKRNDFRYSGAYFIY